MKKVLFIISIFLLAFLNTKPPGISVLALSSIESLPQIIKEIEDLKKGDRHLELEKEKKRGKGPTDFNRKKEESAEPLRLKESIPEIVPLPSELLKEIKPVREQPKEFHLKIIEPKAGSKVSGVIPIKIEVEGRSFQEPQLVEFYGRTSNNPPFYLGQIDLINKEAQFNWDTTKVPNAVYYLFLKSGVKESEPILLEVQNIIEKPDPRPALENKIQELETKIKEKQEEKDNILQGKLEDLTNKDKITPLPPPLQKTIKEIKERMIDKEEEQKKIIEKSLDQLKDKIEDRDTVRQNKIEELKEKIKEVKTIETNIKDKSKDFMVKIEEVDQEKIKTIEPIQRIIEAKQERKKEIEEKPLSILQTPIEELAKEVKKYPVLLPIKNEVMILHQAIKRKESKDKEIIDGTPKMIQEIKKEEMVPELKIAVKEVEKKTEEQTVKDDLNIEKQLFQLEKIAKEQKIEENLLQRIKDFREDVSEVIKEEKEIKENLGVLEAKKEIITTISSTPSLPLPQLKESALSKERLPVVLPRALEPGVIPLVAKEEFLPNDNLVTDTDGDGLDDQKERESGTDMTNPDTDGDGYLDGIEVGNGYNPIGPGKLESSLGPISSLIINQFKDTDNDGLTDEEEKKMGTDPNNSDTDGDGYFDGEEAKHNYSPLIPTKGITIITFEEPIKAGIIKAHLFEVKKVESLPLEETTKPPPLVLQGKGIPNSFVTLYIYSQLPLVVVVKVDAFGNWNYVLDKPLKEGRHEVYVAVTNNTGKIVSKSNPYSFFIRQARAVSPEEFFTSPTNLETKTERILKQQMIIVGIIVSILSLGVLVFLRRIK